MAKQFLDRFPVAPTREIARKMHEAHHEEFPTIEIARSTLRYWRGQTGDGNRRRPTDRTHFAANGDNRRGQNAPVVPAECKILIFDIETSPTLALPWGSFKQFINPDQLLAPQLVMCWSAKWLGEKKTMFGRMDIPEGELPDDPVEALIAIAGFYRHSDYECCEALWHLFDEADMVVAHNGKAYDTTHMRTRWWDHGLPPPSPYKIIDTLWTARKEFNFPRNKLESIARYKNIGKKVEHEGMPLWKKCMCGDPKAWKRMKRYNIQDTVLLEEIYFEFRPWIRNHPNVALSYDGDDSMRCPTCGSKGAMKQLPVTAKTAASEFIAYRCQSCNSIKRNRSRIKPLAPTSERLANVM